jgi:hypothetical protein
MAMWWSYYLLHYAVLWLCASISEQAVVNAVMNFRVLAPWNWLVSISEERSKSS